MGSGKSQIAIGTAVNTGSSGISNRALTACERSCTIIIGIGRAVEGDVYIGVKTLGSGDVCSLCHGETLGDRALAKEIQILIITAENIKSCIVSNGTVTGHIGSSITGNSLVKGDISAAVDSGADSNCGIESCYRTGNAQGGVISAESGTFKAGTVGNSSRIVDRSCSVSAAVEDPGTVTIRIFKDKSGSDIGNTVDRNISCAVESTFLAILRAGKNQITVSAAEYIKRITIVAEDVSYR